MWEEETQLEGLAVHLSVTYLPLCKGRLQMERYSNRGGDSGVAAYEIGPDSIKVELTLLFPKAVEVVPVL